LIAVSTILLTCIRTPKVEKAQTEAGGLEMSCGELGMGMTMVEEMNGAAVQGRFSSIRV